MILVNKAVDPTVAKATSTYPAIITAVGQKSDAFVVLGFYCPSITSGQPYEAVNATLYNSTVSAPITPHDNAEDYDFQRGGVIIVSFENGNLNSPQFVRYVKVSDSVIDTNKRKLDGEPVLADTILSLTDIEKVSSINSPIVKKAASLLSYVRICAKGKIENSDVLNIQVTQKQIIGTKYLRLFKCGIYGVELIGKETMSPLDSYDTFNVFYPLMLEYTGTTENFNREKPSISFLNICNYFYNNVTNPTNTAIFDIFKRSCRGYGFKGQDEMPENIQVAQRIFSNLAGLNDINFKSDTLINAANYTSNNYVQNMKSMFNTIPHDNNIVNMFNNMYQIARSNNELYNLFRNRFWGIFDELYRDQLDRAYAIILHNNIYKLKAGWGLESVDNLILIMTAIVITAYPLIEQTVLYGATTADNKDISNDNITAFLKNLRQYGKDNNIKNDTTRLLSDSDYYKNYFTRLYFYLLGIDINESVIQVFKTQMENNIKLCINAIVSNSGTILNLMQQELTDTSSTRRINYTNPTSATQTGSNGKGLINNYLWPVAGGGRITSKFAMRQDPVTKRGPEVLHAGIDIGTPIGTDIYASADGTVSLTYDFGKTDYGKCIYISHGNGYQTFYAHLSKFEVKKGDKVSKGMVIAKSGNTGHTTGPHLHYGVRVTGSGNNIWKDGWVDPLLPG